MLKRLTRYKSKRRRDTIIGGPVSSGPADELDEFESDMDSDLESSSSHDVEGPTLITVDDGRGGIKHVRVPKPPDTQSEVFQMHLPSDDNGPLNNTRSNASTITVNDNSKPTGGIADLLRRELKGRNFFNLEPHSEKLKKRIVSKKGHVHISTTRISHRRQRLLSDFFNTMLDMKWRWVLLLFTLSFFLSWLLFAVVWWIIGYVHGDFEDGHLPDQQGDTGWKPCVYAINDFASCFLFSVETQHTIGYGSRQTTEECPEAIFIMSFQSVVGVMIQACMVGTIFAKLARPKKRVATLSFSKNAVICLRDGYLSLMFRIGNMRDRAHLVEAHVRAILISKKVTEEGEVIPYHQTELDVGTDFEGQEDTLFIIWPMTLIHRINEDSPFYNMSASDFLRKRYELIVMMEGIHEPTGNSVQARSSYLPNEILWGYRFANTMNYKSTAGEYKIDFSHFNSVYKVDTPTKSAKHMEEEKKNSHPVLQHSASVAAVVPANQVLRCKAQTNHVSLPLLPQIRKISGQPASPPTTTTKSGLTTPLQVHRSVSSNGHG